ncbi:MAG: DCC1-like thiol-disulfide oxidoreductase family protein [Halieaceae bacterium]|jgi:predicted DCC family thiol-disulfide oxidoreductase YuxK|nr:DCC1-like thiol-disulfide oxidoreductase family protein [Halieaceae bacterium]
MTHSPARDTLYYDGNCPLCMREVRLLSRIADSGLALVNLHEVPDQPGTPTRLEKLSTLHMLSREGQWLTGVDATVRAWAHTRWGFFFKVLRWPLLGPVADRVYAYWARKRYSRLYGCGECAGQ